MPDQQGNENETLSSKAILNLLKRTDSLSSLSTCSSLDIDSISLDNGSFDGAFIYSSFQSKWGIIRDWINTISKDQISKGLLDKSISKDITLPSSCSYINSGSDSSVINKNQSNVCKINTTVGANNKSVKSNVLNFNESKSYVSINAQSSSLVNKPNGLVVTDEIREELNIAANSTLQAFTNIRTGNTGG